MMMSSEPFGIHIMIEGFGAPRQLLSNSVYLYSVLEDLPKMMGMRAVTEPQLIESGAFSAANPGSLSGFVMDAESHISFHAVPARGYVTMDFFTQRSGIDRDRVINLLTSSFALDEAEVSVLDCGRRFAGAQLMAA
jgi:S-adenosylmethionine decarboxylase